VPCATRAAASIPTCCPPPFRVESVRSGDRPTGNTAATDQSAADTETVGKLEDSDAEGSPAAVRPTDPQVGAGGPASDDTLAGPPDPVPDDDSPWPEQRPWPQDDPAGNDRAGPDAAGPDGAVPEAAGSDSAASGTAEADAAGLEPGPAATTNRAAGPDDAKAPDLPEARGAAAAPAVGAKPEPRTALLTETRPRRSGVLGLRPAIPSWVPGAQRLRFRAIRQVKYSEAGGTTFARITVLPALLLMAWLLPGIPLLLAGVFLPVPELLIAAPVAVALIAGGLRLVPAHWPRTLVAARPDTASAPSPVQNRSAWWGLAGTVAVALGFAVWQFLFNSESVIVLRDPGAYLQTGYWIAQHGSLPIPQSLASFGGAHPGLGFASTGFYSQGSSVVPGLMSGLPLVLAGGFWVHGITAAAALGPILGGLAVLAFGGLAGRLVGPQWAPAGALVLAFTLPEQYTSRASFSETATQVLLFGGLCLVADALALGAAGRPATAPRAQFWPRWLTPQRATMALGGLALGLVAVVRFDGLLDVLPVIPFAGLLLARRSTTFLSFCIGVLVGAGLGLADGYLLARPFVDALTPAPELIGLIAVWLIAVTSAAVELARLPGLRASLRKLSKLGLLGKLPNLRVLRWLPEVAGVLVVLALAGLLIRPYLQTVREPASRASAVYVGNLQIAENLKFDPGRLYAEDTLYWVIWYVGFPAVLLGGFGLALLMRRCVRALLTWQDPAGAVRIWLLPVMIICCGSAAVLWQPHTVPDQPWASRRLVPLVLPGLIVCAIWAAAWLRERARSRGASRIATSVVAAFCVAALLVPTVATTFGLGLTHSGPSGGLRLSAKGVALKRTGPGQVGAVNGLCSSLGPTSSVVIVDPQVGAEFMQVIRGMCGVPAAEMAGQSPQAVQNVIFSIERTGRRPVLLGAQSSELAIYGGNATRVLDLTTTQDPHSLTQPPTALWSAHYEIWMATLGGSGSGSSGGTGA